MSWLINLFQNLVSVVADDRRLTNSFYDPGDAIVEAIHD
jgi:hypothetical protein